MPSTRKLCLGRSVPCSGGGRADRGVICFGVDRSRLGSGLPLAAALDGLIGALVQPANNREPRPRAHKFLRVRRPAVSVEGCRIDVRAEDQVRERQAEDTRDGLVTADISMVAQVEGVGLAPEWPRGGLGHQTIPSRLGPVFDGVNDFVKAE